MSAQVPTLNNLSDYFTEAERRTIRQTYRRLLKSTPNPTEEDLKLLRRAFEMAVDGHKTQRRHTGEPYVLHPIEVARICAEEIGLGATAIIAALLHDVVEDTHFTLQEIRDLFGDKIAMIVDGLTKLDKSMQTDSIQAENTKKVLQTLTQDVRIILIKIADRLHNMRTLSAAPASKQAKIASETAFIFEPLAHRLGLYNIKQEFQELTMKIHEPENYDFVKNKLNETRRDRDRYIAEFVKQLKDDLDSMDVAYRIFGRPKSIPSIWKKIQSKGIPFEEIYDLFAVRIVINAQPKDEKRFCWHAYTIVTDHYPPIPERLKDWISVPKPNGYESLHTTVVGPKGRFVEVQIRTDRMDQIAERGFAAHWKYKGINSANVYDVWLNSLRDILESTQENAVEMVENVKNTLTTDGVYVYTPKGDMRIFPKGATALDFAFGIHSEIGYHCTGARVNQRMVPLSYKLQTGDIVNITIAKTQKPSESWLEFAVTSKAISKIRHSIKEEKRKAGELGREMLTRKLNALKANFDDANLDFLVKHLGVKSRIDLYYNITEHKSTLNAFANFEVDVHGRLLLKPAPTPPSVPVPAPVAAPKPSTSTTPVKLLIEGENASLFSFSLATCCQPVQGDKIFAYVTQGAGMKIHRYDCSNAQNMLANYAYRVKSAEWSADNQASFVADLLIQGIDSLGLTQRITHTISNVLRVDMRRINLDTSDGFFEGQISVVVFNADQLQFLMYTLQNIEGISSVTRTN